MKKEIRRYLTTFIFLIILLLFFAYYRTYQISIIIFFVVCLISFFKSKYFIIFLYVAMLQTNGLIPTEENLFGIISLQLTINFFALITLMKYFPLRKKIDINQKIAISIIILLFLYANYLNFFNVNVSFVKSLKRLLINTAKFAPLIYLITNIYHKKINYVIKSGIYVSVIIIVLSQIFVGILGQIGIETQKAITESLLIGGQQSEAYRRGGVFGAGGDVNGVSGYLAITLGYYLSRIEKKEKLKQFVVVIIFIVIGILITISRTGFISMVIIISVFIMRNFKKNNLVNLFGFLIISVIFYYVFNDLFKPIFSRLVFNESGLEQSSGATRVNGWMLFFSYIFNNLNVLLIGSRESVSVIYGSGYVRAAHNFYVESLFRAGVFPLFYLIYQYSRYIKLALRKILVYNIFYTMIPFLLISMTVSGYGYFFIFVLTIALNGIKTSNIDYEMS